MRNIQALLSLSMIILAMTLQPQDAQAANGDSIEFMCKAKAKEIAAQTYSGCINDNKQAELERIRKEYQAELSKIKSKYNNELKGLSGKKAKAIDKSSDKSSDRLDLNSAKNLSDMPAKKMTTSKVKTEKIDFSSDKRETQLESPDNSQNDMSSDSGLSSSEIVEIPIQEE